VIVLAAAAVAGALAAALAGRAVRRRLPPPAPATAPPRPGAGRPRLPPRRLALLGTAGWLLAVICVGPHAAVVVTVAAGGLVLARVRRQKAAAPSDCCLAVDLLAGCLGAGATVPDALAAAASAAPPDAAAALASVEAALRAGRAPAAAWSALGRDTGVLADVARACARSAATGAGIAAELRRAAERDRDQRRAQRQQRLQRASVWLVLPLGLCFLPAFVLVGVVPLVLAAAPHVLR
jgi:hypothetical protein